MEFYIDADSTPACTDATAKPSGSTFMCTWDTTTKPDGPHTVTTKAYDLASNSAVSPAVSFTTIPHTLTITTGPSGMPDPAAPGALVSLSVTAADSWNHSLSYAWTALCPATLGSNGSFSNPSIQNPMWTAPTNTTGSQQNCTIEVTVSDGQGLSQPGSYSQGVKPCTYTLSLPGRSHGAGAETGSLSVTTQSVCPWTAVSNDPSWITITSGSPAAGNGTVNYAVAANTDVTPRTDTLTIAG
jgi:hypothetical protein